MDEFYKYIVKNNHSYKIVKNNESYGEYRKLSDALYERDRLVKVNWDWDDLMQLEETENVYEEMVLPPFVRNHSYIYKMPKHYMVFDKRKYKGRFYEKDSAEEYAKGFNGKVIEVDEKYKIERTVNGVKHYFGSYKTLEEAKKRRDELIDNGWKT